MKQLNISVKQVKKTDSNANNCYTFSQIKQSKNMAKKRKYINVTNIS